MSLGELVFVAALATLGVLVGFGSALRRWRHHHRAGRVSRFALEEGAELREGPARIVGRVEHDAEPLEGAPLGSSAGAAAHGTTFWLVMPSGARVQLRLDEDRWTYDATFRPGTSSGVLVAPLRAGDAICVRGRLVREIDRSTTGAGYRDPSRAWVVRPADSGAVEVMAKSELVRHTSRARYHAAWCITVVLGGAWIHAEWLGQVHRAIASAALGAPLPRIGSVGSIVAGTIASWMLAVGYELHRQRTSPWAFHRVTGPTAAALTRSHDRAGDTPRPAP